MAEYKFGCPQCGQHIKCTDDYIGKQINCPNCQKAIIVSRPKGATSKAAIQSTPAGGKSTPSVLRIAVISAVLFGVCLGFTIGGWMYFSQHRALQKQLQNVKHKGPKVHNNKQAAIKPNADPAVEAPPGSNNITNGVLTLISGSMLQARLDAGSNSAPSLVAQGSGSDILNLDANLLADSTGEIVSLKNSLKCFGNTSINVTGSRRETLALGAINLITGSHDPYFCLTVNTLPSGPELLIASVTSGIWGNYLNLAGGGRVTITGNLSNASNGALNLFVNDGTVATLQGVTVKSFGLDAYRYVVVNGTLVLDNNNALTNNTTAGGLLNISYFILGAATNCFSGNKPNLFSPAAGVLTAKNNSYNAAVYLGDLNSSGGLTLNAKNTINVSDGEAGFVNSGAFTIGGQNTSGTNTYANQIILGWTPNKGKNVTLIAATGGEVDFAGGLLANGSDKTAGVTVGDAEYGGIVKFTATNTYGGNTFITNGTLALGGMGSIAKSAGIVLAAGATFDVSGLVSTFSLGTGQTLSNSASTASLNGNINAGSGIISLTYAAGTPALNVANGTLKITSSTVFKIDNTGSALVPGNYQIIARQTGGAIKAVTILPPVSVGGGGIATDATAALQIMNGALYLVVTKQ